MKHDRLPRVREGSLLTRKRFQFVGALILGAVLPWASRGPLLPGTVSEPAALNAFVGNSLAVAIAFWMRLSIETYPGIRRSYVIFPSALTGHGLMLVWFVLTPTLSGSTLGKRAMLLRIQRTNGRRVGPLALFGWAGVVVWHVATSSGPTANVFARHATSPYVLEFLAGCAVALLSWRSTRRARSSSFIGANVRSWSSIVRGSSSDRGGTGS